jgi:hypothetical protein
MQVESCNILTARNHNRSLCSPSRTMHMPLQKCNPQSLKVDSSCAKTLCNYCDIFFFFLYCEVWWSTLDPSLLIIFIHDICASIHCSTYLLLVNHLDMYHSITNVESCKLLQYDVDNVQTWRLHNDMIYTGKTNIISFTNKITSFNKLHNKLVACSQCYSSWNLVTMKALLWKSCWLHFSHKAKKC